MADEQLILVGSYTRSISTLAFTPASQPSLVLKSELEVGHHPSWLTRLPGQSKDTIIFTGLEQSDGEVVTIRFDAQGRGSAVGSTPSGGRDPCTLEFATTDGTPELVVGNYSSGTVASFPISSGDSFLPDAASRTVQLQGTGPNPDRQEASHPHHIYFHGDELLVPDLGADRTWRLQRGATGNWEVRGSIEYAPGSGPRHVLVRDGTLYTALELSNEVSAHTFQPLPATATHLTTVSTFSTGKPSSKDMLVAELLSPAPSDSFLTPYLYVSNRNDPSPEGDTIAIFAIGDGKLELVNEVRTGLDHVRGMAFDKTSRWLVAGGANGGGVKVFERIDDGKNLKEIAHAELEKPTAFIWL